MAQEIERKFLVANDSFKKMAFAASRIKQGYICSEHGRTVRVRIRGEKGYLTIKGASNQEGTSRYEWEKEIPLSEAEELMHLCVDGFIDKTRYLVNFKEHTFEVDEFYGENAGLVKKDYRFGYLIKCSFFLVRFHFGGRIGRNDVSDDYRQGCRFLGYGGSVDLLGERSGEAGYHSFIEHLVDWYRQRDQAVFGYAYRMFRTR